MESASDVSIFELLDDMHPGIAGAEKEADFGEIEIWVRVREGDFGDVELETAIVGEAELIEGDDGSVVGSDLVGSDLGGGEGEEGRERKEEEEDRRRGHGWRNLRRDEKSQISVKRKEASFPSLFDLE